MNFEDVAFKKELYEEKHKSLESEIFFCLERAEGPRGLICQLLLIKWCWDC